MRIPIAVDNQIAKKTVYTLSEMGFKVVFRATDARDEDWVGWALDAGAQFIVSPDLDIPNILDYWNSDCVWIELKQGVKGPDQAKAIYKAIHSFLEKRAKDANIV